MCMARMSAPRLSSILEPSDGRAGTAVPVAYVESLIPVPVPRSGSGSSHAETVIPAEEGGCP